MTGHEILEIDLIVTIGILFGAAVLGGLCGRVLHLPHVTSFLLTGLLLGPEVLGVFPHSHLEYLDPLGKLAMALVLFAMGCRFDMVSFRRIVSRAVRLSAGEQLLTFLLVSVGLFLVGQAWESALLFGALAMATAPATTVLVLKENEAEGPVTDLAISLVAMNNLAAIIIFELLFVAILYVTDSSAYPLWAQVRELGADLAAAAFVGCVAGLVASYACGLLSHEQWLVVLVAIVTLAFGICMKLDLPYLLTFLAMGAMVANSSGRAREIVGQLDHLTELLCVVFFVIHGAELDLHALYAAGAAGGVYVVLRTLGKYGGVFLAANARVDGPKVKQWLGATLLAQAGAAIALASLAAERAPEIGEHLLTIILGTVVVFEIVGPLVLRFAVIRAGEVPLSHAIFHSATTPLDELRGLVNRILQALGRDPWQGRETKTISVAELMRRDVEAISAAATFAEVVEFIEDCHDNTFPVIETTGVLAGVIRYPDLRDAMFDHELGTLVCAADLAIPSFPVLRPDDTLDLAWSTFGRVADDVVFVVDRLESPKLVGILKRRDLFRFFARGNQPHQ
ncbi:MAG: cation:proton antiporter [Planctomycetales bacterium]|nr:cation:proton antiporter [Planctomycetales bacterium]